jgi:LacI family transcriptional regulator
MKQATIRDVAREANVSVASVSRALNGHSSVRPQMRERVLQAVEALGYVPNAAARSLSMALSHTIGVVVPDLHGEFFSELIRGMDIGASASGYQLLLSTMHADIHQAGQALRAMHGRVDGLIVMAPQIDPEELDTLLPPRLPVVLLICKEGRGRPLLRIDNHAGAAEAALHLLSLGRRRIVHISGPSANFEAVERRDGFEEALARLAPDVQSIPRSGDFGEESGAAAIREILDGGETFDAVFAANDMMALGAMQELGRRGIAVPKDVAIIGFDDIPLARFMGLTTMRVHMAELGDRAVRSLAALLGGADEADSVRLAPELIVRSSAG